MELEELKRLRLMLKAARALLRDLTVACAQAEAALANAQPREAQHGKDIVHELNERCVA